MNRKVITGIMLTLLSTSILALAFNIQLVKPDPITIVVPDDYEKIQWAIGNATDGDSIYVRAGIYYENLVVNKALSLNGENKSTTIIDGNKNGSCIYVDGADNVRITGFKIQHGFEQGIFAMSSHGTILSGNTITLNIWTGIRIYDCTDVMVNENDIIDNSDWGVYVVSSSWNNVSRNKISHNGFGVGMHHSSNCVVSNNVVASNNKGPGIQLFFSHNSTLQNNNMTDNLHNLDIEGDFLHEIDLSNTIDGKPIYYLKNQKNLVVNPSIFPDVGYLGVINCNNITVEDLNIKKNGQGLLIAYTQNSVVHNVSVSDNQLGIDLCQSSRNIIAGNNASGNSHRGIFVGVSSDNTICNNTILDNGQVGIFLDSSNDNNVSANMLQNHDYGIYMSNSKHNIVLKNMIRNNDRGISLWSGSSFRECTENTIVGNQISDCRIGIDSRYSDNNIVYHNDFLSNTEQVFSYDSTNVWDGAYPSGGNYWSDYEDRYPYAKELDDSGIWDTPYVIDENNQDRYPLVKPWISPTERKVGVKVGDWTLYQVNYAYNTNDPEPPLPKPPSEVFEIEQFKFFVQNVHNTNVTLQITTYYKDGSQEVTERFIDVNTGEGIPVFLIGANLSAGNIIYPDYWSEIRINETIPRTYLEVIRETNHYGRDTSTHHNSYEENSSSHIYWDRATGFITEAMFETIFTEKTRNYTTYYSSSLQMIATNLWSSIPSSPVEATQELIETIETWNLRKGTENSLKAKLKVAIHMLDLGKEDGAIRKLTAFINRVEMLREKTLTNEQADELVLEAQRIIDLING